MWCEGVSNFSWKKTPHLQTLKIYKNVFPEDTFYDLYHYVVLPWSGRYIAELPMPMRVELNCDFAFLVVNLKSKMHHFTAF